MYKKRLNKRLIIIFLILFPTAMLFGFLNNVRAESDIPIRPHDNNAWTWKDIDVDDELAYEVEIIMTDIETGDLFWQMRYLDILKISDIDSDFFEFRGEYDNMSYVEAKRCYYECYPEGGGEVVEILDSKENPIKELISVFGFNNSDTIKEKFIAASDLRFYPPLLLPLNDSDICPTMHDIIYESQIEPFENIYCNVFDERGLETVDTKRDKIWFLNTTEDYYMNATYFNINGTLESAEMYCIMNMDGGGNGNGGPSGWMAINTTINRVYGPDYYAAITDEVVWNFDVGDDFYFGVNGDEYMITITNKTWCMSFETNVMDLEIPQPYNAVNASLYKWDKESEDYSIYEGEQIIALANNYYPFPLEALFEGGGPVMAVPDGTDAEDMAFLLNNFTMEEWPFEVIIEDDGKIIELTDKEEGGTFSIQYDDLGIMKIGYMEFGGWLEGIYFRKNMTILDEGADWEPLGWDMVGSNEVLVNFTATDDLELYSAVLPVNPLEPLIREDDSYLGCYFEHEIPDLPLYIDMYVNDSGAVGNQASINITYNPEPFSTYNILESAIKVYAFNISSVGNDNKWDEVPETFILNRDEDNDVISLNATLAIKYKKSYFTIGVEESWNWSADVFSAIDDILIYETLGKLSGDMPEVGDVTLPYINHAILNITGVGLVDKQWMDNGLDEFNQVNASIMYYDPEIDDLKFPDDFEPFVLSEYCFNRSRPYPFLFNLSEYMLGYPIIVPLRWNELNLRVIGETLNKTFYSSPFAKQIGFPIWDEIEVNTYANTLEFNSTGTKYSMELTYYDNGTLRDAEVFTSFTIDSHIIDFNLNTTRLYEYNTTDKVEWGVEAGESYYFGSNFPVGGPTIEANITIVEINQTAVFLADLFGEFGGAFMFQSYLTFEEVWADVWTWNITEMGDVWNGEWIHQGTILIAAANNYFPFAPGDYIEGLIFPFLLPNNTDGYVLAEAYADYIGMMTIQFEGELQPTITGVDEEYLRIDLIAPSEPSYHAYIEWYLNNETGITRYWYLYEEYEGEEFIATMFTKNRTTGTGVQDKTIEFDNYLVPDINVTVVIESDDPYDFFEAMLHKNPVNSSMPSGIGTPLFYTDLFIINYTSNPYNWTFTVELPSKYDVAYVKYLAMYIYNPEEIDNDNPTGEWEYELLKDIPFGEVIKNSQNNILILDMENINGSICIVLAWMYSAPIVPAGDGGGGGGDDDKEVAPIPGYDIYILLMILSLISTIIIIQRRKKIRF